MVSTLRSVFNSLLGQERPVVPTRPRKRSFDERTEDEDLMKPDLKRPKLQASSYHKHSVENGRNESPLVRVAEWMKQKAWSFRECYFYRNTAQSAVEDSHASRGIELPRRERRLFDDMYHYKPKTNGNGRHQVPSRLFVDGRKHRDRIANNERELVSESATSKTIVCELTGTSTTGECKLNVKQVSSRLSGGGPSTSRVPRIACHSSQQDESDLTDLPFQSDSSHLHVEPSRIKHALTNTKSYVPVHSTKPRNKSIATRPPLHNPPPPAPRATTAAYAKVVPRSTAPSHKLKPKATYTVYKCLQLQQREEYQRLLLQFTTVDVADLKPKQPPQPVASVQAMEALPKPDTRLTSNITNRPREDTIRQVTSRREVPGGRVLAHRYTSKREIQEAARQRLHAPSSDLSVCITPSSEKFVTTPSQPDFDRSDSPLITDVYIPSSCRLSTSQKPPMSSFQQSLSQSIFATEDWIKDLKERFESSSRERIRRAEEEKIKIKIYEEKRLDDMGKLEQHIRDRMIIAQSEPAVLEDIPEPQPEDEGGKNNADAMPYLTNEMEAVIDKALIAHPGGQTMVEGFKYTLTRSNIQTLNDLNWLNDEVINFYMSLLVERSGQNNFPNVHSFNTFFYPKLVKGGHAPLRRWTKKVDIFSKDLLLVPVHLGMHWCLVVIDVRNKCITYYDSMGNANPQCLKALRQYLYDEHKDKKQQPLDVNCWRLKTCKDIPQQMNGSDCGMFACKYAEYICRDASITFTQEDMPYFRRRMVWEVVNKKLL